MLAAIRYRGHVIVKEKHYLYGWYYRLGCSYLHNHWPIHKTSLSDMKHYIDYCIQEFGDDNHLDGKWLIDNVKTD